MPVDRTLRLDNSYIDVEAETTDYKNIRKRVRKTLREKGILGAGQPLDVDGKPLRPEMPQMGLSSLTPEDTLDLLGQYGAFIEYVESYVADQRVIHSATERTRDHVKARIRVKTRGTTGDKGDAARVSPRFKTVDQKEYEAFALLELSESALRGAYKACDTVSRTITSQGHELDRTKREHNTAPTRRGEFGAPKFK